MEHTEHTDVTPEELSAAGFDCGGSGLGAGGGVMAGAFPATAQMSISPITGRWWLYVALPGPVSQWPEYDLGPGPDVPTVQQRSQALDALGYVFRDGAEWEWAETSERPDDPTSQARLVASAMVREVVCDEEGHARPHTGNCDALGPLGGAE